MDKKGYTLAELKKKYAEMSKKKGYRGWYEATKQNAGNVPLNNAIFNMMMGSSKSVDMAQVSADNFIGDAPASTTTAPAAAAPDGGIGMVGMAEDINNEPLTLKVTFDDGDYLITQYEGTFKDAKDHFVGNSIRWEDEDTGKKGVDVRLISTDSHAARKENMKIQESFDSNKINDIIRDLGSVASLTADDWIALKDSPALNSIRDDLWMYGNEVRALMAYVFEDEPHYDTAEMVYNKYAPRIGVSVDRVLKEIQKREDEERKKKWEQENKPDHFDEGFKGDEHALIERISSLKEGEVLRLKNSHNDMSLEQPLTMCIKKNPKFPGRYILWNEEENGEKLNIINFSSLDNAVAWAKQTDEFLAESKKEND